MIPELRPRLRQSTAKRLLQCSPAQVYGELVTGEHGSDAPSNEMDKGSLLDALVFGGRAIHVVEADDWRTKAAREARVAARVAGHIPALERDLEPLRSMAEACKRAISGLGIEMGAGLADAQKRLEWYSSLDVACSGTPDLVCHKTRTILDLKCTASCNPEWLVRQIDNQHWDLQAAAYSEAVVWPLEESTEPYAYVLLAAERDGLRQVVAHDLDTLYVDVGRKKWLQAQQIWQECWASATWPGYQRTVLSPPRYVVRRVLGYDEGDLSDMGLTGLEGAAAE